MTSAYLKDWLLNDYERPHKSPSTHCPRGHGRLESRTEPDQSARMIDVVVCPMCGWEPTRQDHPRMTQRDTWEDGQGRWQRRYEAPEEKDAN